MFKDADKQRESVREAVRRHRARKRGIVFRISGEESPRGGSLGKEALNEGHRPECQCILCIPLFGRR